MGENEIGRNGKRAGQILGGMGKRRSWKGRKKNGRNGKNLGEMGLGEMELGKLGINHYYTGKARQRLLSPSAFLILREHRKYPDVRRYIWVFKLFDPLSGNIAK